MKILALDASGPFASVALMDDGRILHEICANHGLKHSEALMPLVDQVLRASGVACADIDLFGCVAGPGSFTGVRIGVCTVKGLAHATNKLCAALDALGVLAAGAVGFAGIVCPMLDARRDQVYAACYEVSRHGAPKRVVAGAACSVEEFLASIPDVERLFFTGDGAVKHARLIEARFGERAVIAPAHACYPRAAAACWLAQFAPQTDAAGLLPIYFRASQAEREKSEVKSVTI